MEEAMMAVLLTQDLPVGREDVEAVSAEMGAKENPPDGLIMHTFTVTGEGVHVVDVWESTAHYDRFRDDRLMPAMGKVMAERGISMDRPPPTPEFSEAFDLITGRR
jgi:CheY-like chemotaxis protein